MSYDEEAFERWKSDNELKYLLKFCEDRGIDLIEVARLEMSKQEEDMFDEMLLQEFTEEYNTVMAENEAYANLMRDKL